MPEAILVTIQKGIRRIIIKNDSQLVDNSINRIIEVSKDIFDLVEDSKCLLTHLVVIEWNIVVE